MPENHPPELDIVITSLRNQLYKTDFTSQFLQWHGQPQWQSILKINKPAKNMVTLIIPAKLASGQLGGYIAATIKEDGTVLFEFHRTAMILKGLPEYSVIGLTAAVNKRLLRHFEGGAASKLNSPAANFVDPICWWEYEEVACEQALIKGTSSPEANAAPRPICHDWVEYCEECGCGGGGGGTGGGGGGNGGGGGGNGGGEDCYPFAKGEWWYNFMPPENDCDSIPPPPPPPPLNPCMLALNAARKMDTLYTKGKVDSMLNTMPGWQNFVVEKGYPVLKDCRKINGDTVVMYYLCQNMQTGTDSSLTTIANLTEYSPFHFELWAGAMHTHPQKSYNCPSPADMYHLISTTNAEPKYEGNIIVSANGDTYALTITDLSKATLFYSTMSQNLSGIKWNDNSTIGKAFNDAQEYYRGVYKSYDTTTRRNLAYEMAMSAVLKQFNSGITLHKRDSTGHFQPLIVNTTTPNPNKPKKKVYTQDCILIIE